MGGLRERRRIGSTPLHLNPPLCSGRVVCAAGQQPYLAGLDLQREVLRVDTALGEAPGDEPQARLGGAREHVAQLLLIAESPDGADASRDLVAEQLANQVLLSFVAACQHDQVRGERIAAAHPRSLGDERGDLGKLHQSYLTGNDQIGTADIEVVAATAGEVLELPAGSVFPEIKLEAHALEPIEKVLVHFLRLLGQEPVALPCQWKRYGSIDEVAVLQRRTFVVQRVGELRARLDIDDQGRTALKERDLGPARIEGLLDFLVCAT